MAHHSTSKETVSQGIYNLPSHRVRPEDIPDNPWVRAELDGRTAIDSGQLEARSTTLTTLNGPVRTIVFVPRDQS